MIPKRLQRTLKHGGAPIARLRLSPVVDAPWRGPEPRTYAPRIMSAAGRGVGVVINETGLVRTYVELP